jgi:hypothetical protein
VPAFLKELKKSAVGFRLIMEDNQEPPNVLTLAWGNWLQWLKPDAQGCFPGKAQISPEIRSGIYQVSDLLLGTSDHRYYSIRDYLYDFSQVDELEIHNPRDDLKAPSLTQIAIFGPKSHPMKYGGGVLSLRVQQLFTFQDKESGIDKKTLRVFYNLEVDGEDRGYKEAKCQAKNKNKEEFRCTLELREPYFEWSLRHVVLDLDSIYLKDKAGNQFILDDPKLFAEKAQGTPVSFEFFREDKWHGFNPQELKKDKLF